MIINSIKHKNTLIEAIILIIALFIILVNSSRSEAIPPMPEVPMGLGDIIGPTQFCRSALALSHPKTLKEEHPNQEIYLSQIDQFLKGFPQLASEFFNTAIVEGRIYEWEQMKKWIEDETKEMVIQILGKDAENANNWSTRMSLESLSQPLVRAGLGLKFAKNLVRRVRDDLNASARKGGSSYTFNSVDSHVEKLFRRILNQTPQGDEFLIGVFGLFVPTLLFEGELEALNQNEDKVAGWREGTPKGIVRPTIISKNNQILSEMKRQLWTLTFHRPVDLSRERSESY